jgi:formylglycine-generating enzyme required for sulfatase activity
LARVAWYLANSKKTTHPVGQKEPNAFALYDMHGNVLQWCWDWHEGDYYSKSLTENPDGPTQGAGRVLRGSSWGNDPGTCTSAFRNWNVPGNRYYFAGLRVVVAPVFRTQ